ncbi:polyphosphate polymerase domain-containing protein [Plebeiibacterium sediminum]|uniref:Polyphosphate polymerase domain-containing protein n=1 Tax=Plebeiibacterium sediminum TaxID=2992112 RepID=A0AAE3M1Q4_9BACT|nr:polyphosphate polymerase domain-containing protein [Plebeiobacterium sediminum]MCW3785195.1 polyphosphate polymerase domain-containing protein [Plebeiobacterium sediminum]
MKRIESSFFKPIHIDQIDNVKLMDRTDTKYCIAFNQLQEILNSISTDYYALSIENMNQLKYATTYYDTYHRQMYGNHHRGKLNRYKIRKRTYLISDTSFLEVKFKSNKGRTIKNRMEIPQNFQFITFDEQEFISNNTPYKSHQLYPVLNNRFTRITLVNKRLKERCTIDFNLRFYNDDRLVKLDDLVIVEVKTGKRSEHSSLVNALRERKILPCGFSMYCIGLSLIEDTLKKNAFKPKLRAIHHKFKTTYQLQEVV